MMDKKYNYFVSYVWGKGFNHGYSHCNLERNTEIKNIDEINVISRDIAQAFNRETVVILNYILLSKPEEENEGCELCRYATYTETPFIVTKSDGSWEHSRTVQFYYCPVCGKKLLDCHSDVQKDDHIDCCD